MTIQEFNKKYENITIDYPNYFNNTRINKIELLKDENIAKIIKETEESNINLEKMINFQKQVLNDLKQIKGD